MSSRLLLVPVVAVLLTLAACSQPGTAEAESVEVPQLGACRVLAPEDVAAASNSVEVVDCADDHTAETYAVGSLPGGLDMAAYDDPDVGAFAYKTCAKAYMRFLGADESLVMRTLLSWAWFRPSEDAWDDGARWYRCDVVGGNEDATSFITLPVTVKGLMASGRPDDTWMSCVDGESVSAWLDYPLEYKFAYTWFHEAEWKTGNRRSICWAWTTA